MAKPRAPAKKKFNKLRPTKAAVSKKPIEKPVERPVINKPDLPAKCIINKTIPNKPISQKYSLRLCQDTPSIFDRISDKRVNILSNFVSKEVSILIEDYERYDWFNLLAETIMINSCNPILDNYEEKMALALREKVRQRLVDNFNKVLPKSARSSYPLKSIILLFKRYIKKDCKEAKHNIFGDTNQFTDFNGLLYNRLDGCVNEDVVMVCSYGARLMLHSALSKFGLPEIYVRGFGFYEDEGLMSISIYRLLWPYGKKRTFFFLPEINEDDVVSDDSDNESDSDTDSDYY
jgi:predicted DNA-binding protein YlxM (UPF0122 family)